MFNFGKTLKQLRKDCHLTQVELGQKIGVTSQVVSNWERGYTTCADPDLLRKLAELFSVTLDVLLGNEKFNASDKNLNSFVYENSFPEKLKGLMGEKKIDSEMLSKSTGISERRIDSYIYSRVQPMAEDLIKLSEYFEVSIDWMLDMSRRKNISSDEENLLHYYSMMSEDCKRLLSSEAYLLYVKGISGVAAPEYGRCLDPEEKSYPSNGTEGKSAKGA